MRAIYEQKIKSKPKKKQKTKLLKNNNVSKLNKNKESSNKIITLRTLRSLSIHTSDAIVN